MNKAGIGKSGFSFSFLDPKKPTSRNTLDLICVALSKLADPGDPVITEAWRALERQFAAGRQHGYTEGYEAGLAAGAALSLAADEIKQIAKNNLR